MISEVELDAVLDHCRALLDAAEHLEAAGSAKGESPVQAPLRISEARRTPHTVVAEERRRLFFAVHVDEGDPGSAGFDLIPELVKVGDRLPTECSGEMAQEHQQNR